MKNRLLLLILVTAFAVCAILYCTVFAPQGKSLVADTQAAQTQDTGVIVINEIMSKNPGSVPDEYGKYPDWVELKNMGVEPVNLSGWGLTDQTGAGARYIFPDVTLQPGGYIVIWCSGTSDDQLHAPFKLKANKDIVQLLDGAGTPMDTVVLLPVDNGYTFGRSDSNPDEWVGLALPTPGYPNTDAGRDAYEKTLVPEINGLALSEIMPSNKTTLPGPQGNYPDWIELYNGSSDTLDISGMGLSDDRARPVKWVFPEGTKVEPGQYLIVYCDGAATLDSPGELHASFKLSGYKESVLLADKKGRVIESVDYSEIPADASMAKDRESGEWKVSVTPSPGFANDEDGFLAATAKYDGGAKPVYISEVMMTNNEYAPDGKNYYDWIEVHNQSNEDVDISGYGLTDNTKNPAKWRFPEGTILKAGQYKLVQASGLGQATENYLHLSYKLSNSNGELLALFDGAGKLLDRLSCAHQYDHSSYGRDEDGTLGYYSTPTPEQPNGRSYTAYAPMPQLTLQPGFYSGAQTVELSVPAGGYATYTLDGSPPDESSQRYDSAIPVSKTTVVRARAYRDGFMPSRVTTGTYFIDHPHSAELTLVSMSTENGLLFDPVTGIYEMGPDAASKHPFKGANFWKETEIPAHLEIFSPDGTMELSQDIYTRIFGAYSRAREQKGFAIVARSDQGPSRLMAPVFADREYADYKSLVLRASAQDCTVTKIRDIIATSLVDGTNDFKTELQTQAYRQAVLYINGEYFGVYNIREKINKHFLQQHYGVDPDNLDILVGNGSVLHGTSDDYKELLAYCEAHNLSDQTAYDYVASRVDIANYIDYLIAEMYIANTDTGNIKWFRERKEGSKYRWLYYDFCWSLSDSDMDSFDYLTNPKGHGVGKGFSTQLTRSLFQNDGFSNQFLNRFAELLKTVYRTDNVLARIEECEARIVDEIERDVLRWPEGISAGNWRANVKHAKEFAELRPGHCIEFLKSHFGLSNDRVHELFGDS